jgi:hypothetical protein
VLCGTVVLCGASDSYMILLLYRTVVLYGTVL